jgi:preprotein translocase subunit SecD
MNARLRSAARYIRLLAGAPLILLLAACVAVEEVIPCWVELRGDYRAVPLDEPVTAISLAEVSGLVDRRLDDFGVDERTVFTWGHESIVVGLPERYGTQDVRELVTTTGQLDVVAIPEGMEGIEAGSRLPPGLLMLLDNRDLADVRAARDARDRPALEIDLHANGAERMAAWTELNVGNQFAMAVDGTIIAAPTVAGPLREDSFAISGNLQAEELDWMASLLGHSPLPLGVVEESFARVDMGECPPEE